jgi:hypothetical protein
MTERILFYRTGDPYGDFSTFAPFPIKIGGILWPTSEHFFQAQKFSSADDREAILHASSPMNAAKMGRDRSRLLRPDWEAIKDSVMLQALREKFYQHLALAAMLAGTGDAEIVEHTTNDHYWADGGDGSGRNMLGKLLMRIRPEVCGGPDRPLSFDPPCDHLRPLESALIAAGVKEISRGQAWSNHCRLWVSFDCRLEMSSLRERFHFATCVTDHLHQDSHTGEELGFYCEEHLDGVMGYPAIRWSGVVFR